LSQGTKRPEPKNISLTAVLDVQAAPDAGADGKAPLPRFSMVAYTGGLMRIAAGGADRA
jgi:hypothetical protein